MKRVAGRLRLDLAQFRELEAFSAFASDLDRASRAQLDRGGRLVELLKQTNYSPVPPQEETVAIWAGTAGKLDDVPVSDVQRFEADFLSSLRHSNSSTLEAIAAGTWDDDIIAALDHALTDFKQGFLASDGGVKVHEKPADAMGEGIESTEKVTRYVPPKQQ
jgi:F0F1-type ATP synthase, alpha subunit